MAFRKPIKKSKPRSYLTLSRLILEKLAELGEAVLDSFFPAKYPEARLWRSLLGLDEHYRFQRQTFVAILARLRVQGLVARMGPKKRPMWRISTRGIDFISKTPEYDLPRPDGVRRIVVFDIPEKERRKRGVIRFELVSAGYTQLQKSVWHGDRPLSADFMERLHDLNLGRHVHIFSIRDSGTL